MKKVWIVAEIGCNHDGNEETARKMEIGRAHV